MNRCAIISGGDFAPLTDIGECEYIIACDKGYEYCLQEGVRPDLLVGDFDSYRGAEPEDVETVLLPYRKNDTDTLYAFRLALRKGYRQISLYCAFGGRFDHQLANLQTAIYAAKRGCETYIYAGDEEVLVTDRNHILLNRKEGRHLSIFAADVCRGVSIKGAQYDLDNADLFNHFPIGVSNEFVSDVVSIEKKFGVLIIVFSAL